MVTYISKNAKYSRKVHVCTIMVTFVQVEVISITRYCMARNRHENTDVPNK